MAGVRQMIVYPVRCYSIGGKLNADPVLNQTNNALLRSTFERGLGCVIVNEASSAKLGGSLIYSLAMAVEFPGLQENAGDNILLYILIVIFLAFVCWIANSLIS